MKNKQEKLEEIYDILLQSIKDNLTNYNSVQLSNVEALKIINNIILDNNEQ